MKLRIGSRGSQLALWQANHIAGLLRVEGHDVEIEIIKTTGDVLQEVTFAQVGSKGMFTKEIEEALADGRVDLACIRSRTCPPSCRSHLRSRPRRCASIRATCSFPSTMPISRVAAGARAWALAASDAARS